MPPRKIKKPSSQLQFIGEHFDEFHKNGQGYVALCPLHDDNTPSLSVNQGKDGRILLNCFAGCPTESVLEIVGLRMQDLMPDAKQATTYDYTDEDGKLLSQVVKKSPWDPTKKKTMYLRQPDSDGGWINNIKKVRRVLYRLPELLAAKPTQKVFVVEGETDVDRLWKEGLVATTNPCGANSPWLESYSEAVRDRHVVLIPDADTVGWERVEKIARSLDGVAASVKIIELDVPEKGDVSDWIDSGRTKKHLLQIVRDTQPYETTGQQDNRTIDDPLGSNTTTQRVTQRVEALSRCVLGPLGTFRIPCALKMLPTVESEIW